jgi:hypothetical protein
MIEEKGGRGVGVVIEDRFRNGDVLSLCVAAAMRYGSCEVPVSGALICFS